MKFGITWYVIITYVPFLNYFDTIKVNLNLKITSTSSRPISICFYPTNNIKITSSKSEVSSRSRSGVSNSRVCIAVVAYYF